MYVSVYISMYQNYIHDWLFPFQLGELTMVIFFFNSSQLHNHSRTGANAVVDAQGFHWNWSPVTVISGYD